MKNSEIKFKVTKFDFELITNDYGAAAAVASLWGSGSTVRIKMGGKLSPPLWVEGKEETAAMVSYDDFADTIFSRLRDWKR